MTGVRVTDWTSGERVFAPPTGTLDPAWLVPALLEAVPGTAPDAALSALVAAWSRVRAEDATGTGAGAGADPLDLAADRIVAAAVQEFRAR